MQYNLKCSASVNRDHGEFFVHQFSSGADTFFTNAFVVETSNSLVVIDSMMTVSEARSFGEYISTIGKPVAAILITHGHPDPYNGVGQLVSPKQPVPVITTRAVNQSIQGGIDSKVLKWKPVFGSEWPDSNFVATEFMMDGEKIDVDGVPFEISELGAGESNADTCWFVGKDRRAVFVGDVVFNGMHSFMNDGHSSQWIVSLSVLITMVRETDRIYTGHGMSGPAKELISAQANYLECYRQSVFALSRGLPYLDWDAKQALLENMNAYLGTDKLGSFVTAGADAVAGEMVFEHVSTASPIDRSLITEMKPQTFYVAQMSISRARAPLDHPMMQGFVSQLPVINGLADRASGFVWRLQTYEGNSTGVRAFEDPSILMNLSLWESVEQLKYFVYKSPHADPYKNAREWFEKIDGYVTVLWWVIKGHLPTEEEGVARLNHLNKHGPSAEAFTFQKAFPPPDELLRTPNTRSCRP